jgi:branched-chain amino acid transport system substrate-binding protein
MDKRPLLHLVVVAFAALTLCGEASAQDIKIGFNGDLSASPSAQSGSAGVLGIRAALDDINASGGVLGHKLVLIVRDDLSQPPKSIQNMTELIDSEKVVAILGPTNSGNALAWKHLVNQKKVVSMQMIAAGTDITKPMSAGADNYVFRVSIVDREQVVALMAYAKKAGVKKLGLLAETTGYGQGGLKDMQEIAQLQGMDVAAVERMGVADTDVTSQLNKMKAASVDTLMIWAQGTPIGQVMRSMEKINYFPRVLSSWAADNITFFDAAGKALAEKPIFMRTMVGVVTPRQKALFERTKDKLAAPSSFSFTVHGYDATQLLVAAIRQAGTTDAAHVRQALEALKSPYEGVKKTYAQPFSKTNHEALTADDFAFVKWSDGKLVQVNDAVTASLVPSDFKR